MPPPLYVDGRVDVAIQDQPALGAGVDANREILLNPLATATAFLRCASWVHPVELSRGAFSLRFEYLSELCPPGIMNLLGQTHLRKALDVEILDGDRVEPTHDVERRLVVKVEPHPTDTVVLLGEQANGRAPEMASPAAQLATFVPATTVSGFVNCGVNM